MNPMKLIPLALECSYESYGIGFRCYWIARIFCPNIPPNPMLLDCLDSINSNIIPTITMISDSNVIGLLGFFVPIYHRIQCCWIAWIQYKYYSYDSNDIGFQCFRIARILLSQYTSNES